MSNEKDKVAKPLTREVLVRQLEETRKGINYAQQNITILTQQLHNQQGILSFTEHLLAQFDIPSEPKEDPKKKTDLEVK